MSDTDTFLNMFQAGVKKSIQIQTFLTGVNSAEGYQKKVLHLRDSYLQIRVVSDESTDTNPCEFQQSTKVTRIYIPVPAAALAENIDVVTSLNLVHEVSLLAVTDVG